MILRMLRKLSFRKTFVFCKVLSCSNAVQNALASPPFEQLVERNVVKLARDDEFSDVGFSKQLILNICSMQPSWVTWVVGLLTLRDQHPADVNTTPSIGLLQRCSSLMSNIQRLDMGITYHCSCVSDVGTNSDCLGPDTTDWIASCLLRQESAR